MTNVRIELDKGGVAELLKSDAIRKVLAKKADKVLAAAIASAPVDTGAYRDSIHRESRTTDRAVELVVASDRKAPLIEARTGNLARALNAAGI